MSAVSVCWCESSLLCGAGVTPAARSDLLGSEGVVEFTPGTRLMNIILAPRDDVIPEVCDIWPSGSGKVEGGAIL